MKDMPSMDALRIPLCSICNIKLENMKNLDTHMKIKHNETEIMRIERLTLAVKTVRQGENTFKNLNKKSSDCTECGLLFNTIEDLNNHNTSVHGNLGEDQQTSKNVQIMIDDMIEKVIDISETESSDNDDEVDSDSDDEEINVDYQHSVEKVSCQESFKGEKNLYLCNQ